MTKKHPLLHPPVNQAIKTNRTKLRKNTFLKKS